MRTAEEKLEFKNHFFRLGQGLIIPHDKEEYWQHFWKFPETSGDIYDLFTGTDIKTVRDQNITNFILFIRRLSLKLVDLTYDDTFPSEKTTIVVLNCVRFLTKLIPFLYETESFPEIEDDIFWKKEFNVDKFVKSTSSINVDSIRMKEELGVSISKALLTLGFIKSFTIDVSDSSKNNRLLSVWEPGIGSSAPASPSNPIIDSNRTEILRLLLTINGVSFYQSPSKIVSKGSKFLSYLVTCTPKVELLTLVCSLVNLVCRTAKNLSEDGSMLYNSGLLNEMRNLCVTYSIQMLAVMLVYPLPSKENLQFLYTLDELPRQRPFNMARVYMGKLHKQGELNFLGSYLIDTLRNPIPDFENSKSSVPRTNNQPSLWATETVIILWELMQCNKNFKTFISEKYMDELIVILLHYITSFYSMKQHKNLTRVCCYFLLFISSDVSSLDKIFIPVGTNFPSAILIKYKNLGALTTRDYAVTTICNLLCSLPMGISVDNHNGISDLLLTTLVEILYNLIPLVSSKELPTGLDNENPRGGLSYGACSSITQLIKKFTSRTFLLDKPIHPDLLALIIRSVCIATTKHSKPSRMLLFSILKNEKVYDQVWNTIYSFDLEYFSGNSLKLSSIDDVEEQDPEGLDKLNLGLSQVNSHASEVLAYNDIIPDNPLSTSLFIQSLIPQGSNTDSVHNLDFSQGEEGNGTDNEDEAIDSALRPKLPPGMSKKAKDKFPKEAPLKRTWGGNDSLRIILTIILPYLKLIMADVWTNRNSEINKLALIKRIENSDFKTLLEDNKSEINADFFPHSPLEPLRFTWSYLSLGWYISLLYGNIYNSIDVVRRYSSISNKIMKNLSTSLMSISKITSNWVNFSQAGTSDPAEEWVKNSSININHWAATSIKLFKIEYQNEGFFSSFSKGNNQAVPGTPGSVNDMANLLVRRFSDFRMNNNSSRVSVNSNGSYPVTGEEENPRHTRNSVSSLQSLNTLNRTRSNTPRNSISM